MAGTYKSAQKKYYWKNREKIQEKTKEYKKEYNALYYQKNKASLDKKRAEARKKERLLAKTKKSASKRKRIIKNILESAPEVPKTALSEEISQEPKENA